MGNPPSPILPSLTDTPAAKRAKEHFRDTDTDAWFIVKVTGIEKGGIGGGVMGVGGGGWEGATVSQLGRDEGSVILKFNIKRQPSNA